MPEDADGNDRWDQVDFDDPANGSLLFKAESNDAGFYSPATIEQDFEQKYPDIDDVNRFDVFLELMTFVDTSTDSEFIAEIGTRIDLESLADFWILRLVTSNADTMKKNYYMARNMSEKWFFVPWDFDATFGVTYDGQRDPNSVGFIGTYQNQILSRLFDLGVTEFTSIVKSRWTQLRGGLLTPTAIANRFESYIVVMGEDQSGLEEQARSRNLQRWPDSGNSGSGDFELGEKAFIEQWLTDRLDYVDSFIDGLP